MSKQELSPQHFSHKEKTLGEIRSTIDLIMERTRGMTLSVDERENLHREELEKRAKGFRLKLLDKPEEPAKVLEALDSDPPEDRKALEALIWQEMARNLPKDKEILTHIDIMQNLPQAKGKGDILAKMRGAFKASVKEVAEDRKKILAREKKKLAAIGISGTAVVPKFPKNPELDSDVFALVEACQKELLAGSA